MPRIMCLLVLTWGDGGVMRFDGITGDFFDNFVPSNANELTFDLALGADKDLYISRRPSFAHGRTSSVVSRHNGFTGALVGIFATPAFDRYDFGPLTFGPDGNLYVCAIPTASRANTEVSIWRYNGSTGAFLDTFVPPNGALFSPFALVFGPEGNLYVTNANSTVLRYDGVTGALIDELVLPDPTGMDWTSGLTFGPDGSVYVTGAYYSDITRFDRTTGASLGDFVSRTPGGEWYGIAFGPDQNLYICEAFKGVLRYDGTTGTFIDEFAPVDGWPARLAFLEMEVSWGTLILSWARRQKAWALFLLGLILAWILGRRGFWDKVRKANVAGRGKR